MAKRPQNRRRRVLKTTIDSSEIGHDLIEAMVEQCLAEGCSEATAVRKLIFLGSLVKSGRIVADDTLKQLLAIGDHYPVRVQSPGARATDTVSRTPEIPRQREATPKLPPVAMAPAESDQRSPHERAVEVAAEKRPEAAMTSSAPRAERPRGMLSGLKGMMVSADPIEPRPVKSQVAAETMAKASEASRPAPPVASEPRHVQLQVRPAPITRMHEATQAQSPAAISNALAAKLRVNGRDF